MSRQRHQSNPVQNNPVFLCFAVVILAACQFQVVNSSSVGGTTIRLRNTNPVTGRSARLLLPSVEHGWDKSLCGRLHQQQNPLDTIVRAK